MHRPMVLEAKTPSGGVHGFRNCCHVPQLDSRAEKDVEWGRSGGQGVRVKGTRHVVHHIYHIHCIDFHVVAGLEIPTGRTRAISSLRKRHAFPHPTYVDLSTVSSICAPDFKSVALGKSGSKRHRKRIQQKGRSSRV